MSMRADHFLVPLNRAACMNQIQHLVGLGYYWWHAGSVAAEKAPALLEKFASLYPIEATASQRSTRKKKHLANVQLLMCRDEAKPGNVQWFLLATRGKALPGGAGYPDLIHQREKMKDAREIPLVWHCHYVLRHRLILPWSVAENRRAKYQAAWRWTWCMTRENWVGWRDQVGDAARLGDRELQAVFSHLMASPLYAGIRSDLVKLEMHARSAWKKSHRKAEFRPPLPDLLPFMPRIKVYGELTLAALVEQIHVRRDTESAQAMVEAVAAMTD